MSGFHIATPGAGPSSIALQARTAAPRQVHHSGGTIADIAGKFNWAEKIVPLGGVSCTRPSVRWASQAEGCAASRIGRNSVSYRNKTYVIFDGDDDMWAYAYMKGWKSNENVAFNFYDAHDIRPLTDTASEETVRKRLRLRLSNAKQVVILVGEKTKNLYKFVRWEIDIAQKLDLPIVAVNLNGLRQIDPDHCPPILRAWPAVHVAFKAAIIQHALDNFPNEYPGLPDGSGPRYYTDTVYKQLGL